MNLDMLMDGDISPIVIATNKILVKCGESGELENKCIIYGGKVQFQIEGNAKGIAFSGIHFMGALSTSINAFGDTKSDVLFSNCRWENGLGSQIIHINSNQGDTTSDPGDASYGTSTKVSSTKKSSMSMRLVDCIFASNTASASIIVNVGGFLTLERNVFIDNEAENAVISVSRGGTAKILENCFLNNAVNRGLSVITFFKTASLIIAQGNFGRSNVVGKKNTCNEILINEAGKPDENRCIPFDADDCPIYDLPPTSYPSIEPTLEPSLVPHKEETIPPTSTAKICFDNWKDLSYAVKNSATQDEFIICPKTTLDLDAYPEEVSPIVINSKIRSIICGEDGAKSNACVFSGGINQFQLGGQAKSIKFMGITFENSRGISVHAGAAENSFVDFLDCEWRNNEGSSAILMFDTQKDDSAMSARFSNCTFTNNEFADAAIVNIGGILAIEYSLFFRNQASDGVISVLENGEVSISYSCFVQNEKSAVNLSENSNIVKNKGNFAIANGNCNGVLDKDDKKGIICGDACEKFSSKTCYVQDFDKVSFPTSSPVITLQPICIPVESRPPSIGINSSDSGSPSFEPSKPTFTSPQPSENPTNVSNYPTATEIPSLTVEVDTVSPSDKSKPPIVSFSRSENPSLIKSNTKDPSSKEYPSVRPSRIRIPSVVSVPVVATESFLPTSDTAENSEFPTEMSLSMYYNFFYRYD
jgi:hypothetical protein